MGQVDPLKQQARLDKFVEDFDRATPAVRVVPPPEDEAPLAEAAGLSDDCLALSFAGTRPEYRRVAAWGKWMKFDGGRWAEDATLSIFTDVREFLRWRAKRESVDETVCALRSKQRVAAVESLARSDRRYVATASQWDADPWLLNTPAGALDLKTGTLLGHTPEQYLTKQATVSPLPGCPQWLKFIDEITGGNEELAAYLQRLAGYCMTGITTEHALVFCYGTGGNGKSVFLNTISRVLGDYAAVAPMTTFTETKNEQHPTDLAGLRGARLVIATETEAGKGWNEARIKQLSGGDPISARLLRGDFFTFIPTFKLVIAGNHRPRVQNADEAMRRRLHIVPFTVTIPPERRDPKLAEKLEAEGPGILAWMVAGCLEWREGGLNPPPQVRAATTDYFDRQDVFAAWLEEHCEIGSDKWALPKELYASWKQYAEERRERVGRQSDFCNRMDAAGFSQPRDNRRGRYWLGISVKSGTEEELPF